MDKLYQKCINIVVLNTDIKDKETIELLATSIMAILLYCGPHVISKIEKKLKEYQVISDDRSVSEILDKKDIDIEEEYSNNIKACVDKSYIRKNGIVTETNTLIIPKQTKKEDTIDSLERATHELFHIIREEDTIMSPQQVEIIEGVMNKKISFVERTIKSRNEFLEEAIVQKSAKESIQMLLEYLANEDTSYSSLHTRIKKECRNYESHFYCEIVYYLEQLLKSNQIKEIMKDTFQKSDSKALSHYFNEIMDDNSAFGKLSILFDRIEKEIEKEDTDYEKLQLYRDKINEYIHSFQIKEKQYQKIY